MKSTRTLAILLELTCFSCSGDSDSSPDAHDSRIDGGTLGERGDEDGDGIVTGRDNCRLLPNPAQHDRDGDGSGDVCDNCPEVANHSQSDRNGDGTGDACADVAIAGEDGDGDGVATGVDNCWNVANADQLDSDGDNVGDVCDNCGFVANTTQVDNDDDGAGDACSASASDRDGDSIEDRFDNCSGLMNADQVDRDRDGVGDACDNCPFHANRDQADADADGEGDACNGVDTSDADGDGAPDAFDNCRGLENDQADQDNDFVGDACDNCVEIANFDQVDADADGVGDACEGVLLVHGDSDGDGLVDVEDNCPFAANDQSDADGDGVGDDCDNCPNEANFLQDDVDGNGIGDACESRLPAGTDICIATSAATAHLKSDLYIALDTSGSMDTLLNDAKNALDTLAPDLLSSFNVGLGTFPASDQSNDDVCNPANLPRELFDLQVRDTSTQSALNSAVSSFQQSYASLTDAGRTPTAKTLEQLLARQLYAVGNDASSDPARKAVIVITDGNPNATDDTGAYCDETIAGSLETDSYEPDGSDASLAGACNRTRYAAKRLNQGGVRVFVIGFTNNNVNADCLQDVAVAGNPEIADKSPSGGQNWFDVTDQASLTAALQTISSLTLGCDLALTGGSFPPLSSVDVARMEVVLTVRDGGGSPVSGLSVPNPNYYDSSEYTVDQAAGKITLSSGACAELTTVLQQATASGHSVSLDANLACLSCQVTMETCDGVDNNCDHVVDEGCASCSPEVCDGTDNDCDGITDEGCGNTCRPEICDGLDNDCNGVADEGCGTPPSCSANPEICDGLDNDCDGMIDEGCGSLCVPAPEACDGLDNDCDGVVDDQCCAVIGFEVCDGIDNDCDGTVDDGCRPSVD